MVQWFSLFSSMESSGTGLVLSVQGKLFNITVIQAYAPTSNAEKAEVEWFYEDLQDLIELTPNKDVLFIMRTGMQKQEVKGEGIGMGNTCKSMADSCQCMTKTTTIL